MKAISLWQPWASAIALGLKTEETRSWPFPASLKGQRLAIHAAKRRDPQAKIVFDQLMREPWFADPFRKAGWATFFDLPVGCYLATARLVKCVRAEEASPSDWNRWLGFYGDGSWAWILKEIEPLPRPIFAAGRQGFWDAPLV